VVRDKLTLSPEEVKIVSEIKRKKNESFESFMRRVKRIWQQSGKVLQARKVQFFEESKSKNVQRKNTVKRLQMKAKLDYLLKVGRLPAEMQEKLTAQKNKKK
jgi:ribosomal protein S21